MEPRFLIFMVIFFVLTLIIIVTHIQLYKMVKQNFFRPSLPVEEKKTPENLEITQIKKELDDLKSRIEKLEENLK